MTETTPKPEADSPPLLVDRSEGILNLTMNRPKRLNGWTRQMMDAIRDALKAAAVDDEVKVVILTGEIGRAHV